MWVLLSRRNCIYRVEFIIFVHFKNIFYLWVRDYILRVFLCIPYFMKTYGIRWMFLFIFLSRYILGILKWVLLNTKCTHLTHCTAILYYMVKLCIGIQFEWNSIQFKSWIVWLFDFKCKHNLKQTKKI